MFSGAATSEYDDIVNKTTDENLTSENWELILNLCDKVQDEGQTGAHSAIAAILKRLAHRNPNVQLYALSLAEALSKNLDIVVHQEIASRAFTQGLEKLITDRNTHEKVRRRALGLVATWTADFEKDTSLGIMEDCYNNLKAKNYKFEQSSEPAPPAVDDEIRRKEEEELQRVLEMSMQDRGRPQWTQYSSTSFSTAVPNKPSVATSSSSAAPAPHPFAQPKYPGGGYVPARTPSPVTPASQPQEQQHFQQPQTQPQPQSHNHTSSIPPPSAASSSPAPAPAPAVAAAVVTPAATTAAPAASTTTSPSAIVESGNIVTRVRALHTFEPTEPGELAFEKNDIIKVVDRGYKDWWRGQLKGRTGIFPVNYVEAMPEPTAAELAKEAEQEAAVFAQAVNVERLLNMLRALDPAKDNLADNEEIQELYRSSMALRPKIVKLIDKYSQKRADLVSMNETFVRARTIFDRMMEESLARHTGVYDQPAYQYQQGRPDSRSNGRRQPEYQSSSRVPQAYGWSPNVFEQPGYNAYINPASTHPGQIPIGGPSKDPTAFPTPYGTTSPGPSGLGGLKQQQPQGYSDPNASSPYGPPGLSGLGPKQQQPQGYTDPNMSSPYGPSGPSGLRPKQQRQQSKGYIDPNVSSPYGPISAPSPSTSGIPQQQQQMQAGYSDVGQAGYAGHQPQQGPMPYPAQQQPAQQQPVQQQPVQQQPVQQQPIQQQLVQQQPFQQQPVQQQSVQQQPVQQQPVQQQPVQQQPFQQQPVLQQPVQQQPVQQQPIQQQPVQQQLGQQQPIQQPAQHQLQQQQPISQQPIQTQQQPVQAQAIQQQPVQAQPTQQQHVQAQAIQQQPQFVQQYTQGQPLQQQQQPSQSQPVQQPIQVQQAFAQEHEQEQSLQYSNQAQPETQPQPQSQSQPQPQPQAQAQASADDTVSPQPQAHPQAQPKEQQKQQPAGPPYIYDPNTTYANPNVQAWARYYAQGGKDLAGSIYFISIPGLTDAPATPQQREPQQGQQGHNQAQQQQQQQQSANGDSGRRSPEGYNTSVQQQQQPYQTQPQASEMNPSYAAGSRQQQPQERQEQKEQPSQLQDLQPTQLSQYQQAQHVQNPTRSTKQRSQSMHDYGAHLQQQSSVTAADVLGPIQSSPTRSTFPGLNRGTSLSAVDTSGGEAGTSGGSAAAGGPTTATPSWVLPKKTPPATVAGGSPLHLHKDVGGNGLFGGVSLSDPGVGGGDDGVNRSSPGHGVGTLA